MSRAHPTYTDVAARRKAEKALKLGGPAVVLYGTAVAARRKAEKALKLVITIVAAVAASCRGEEKSREGIETSSAARACQPSVGSRRGEKPRRH